MDVSHAAVAAFTIIIGIGIGLLVANNDDKSARDRSALPDSIEIHVPRRIAIEALLAQRKELVDSAIAYSKVLGIYAIAGMAVCGTLLGTTRASALLLVLAFILFSLAFLSSIIPLLGSLKPTARQLSSALAAVYKSKEETALLSIGVPQSASLLRSRLSTMYTIGLATLLVAMAIFIPSYCTLNATASFGDIGTHVCSVMRSL